MAFLRSILSVVIGIIVAVGAIAMVLAVSNQLYAPGVEVDWKNKADVKAFIDSLPLEAFVLVLVSYAVGSFLGGGVAAFIASVWRTFHAGVIGTLVLVATVGNFAMLKYAMDIDHPDWMIVVGLLLPLPLSLIAGAFVAKLTQGRNP